MARLIYGINASLDGYINDERGEFDFTEPSEELHDYWTELVRGVGTWVYGRRMYETMAVWETMRDDPDLPEFAANFARAWCDSDKIVISTTLETAPTERTWIERSFDAERIRELKLTADRDLAIVGPTVAAHAFRAGLVDEVLLAVLPAIVGGGTRALPDGVRLDLELIEERAFPGGAVALRYSVR
ncbi:dihydrofolate reductase family protein [Demequina sp.]|uniref:dihydrofolate reductase family protein n=1 Tax=Demequina sp. TaxID=2050685 RepID=UPI0025D68D47|nr:dihydrofolate reductase family protein [Demequina sp.]